MHIPKEKRQKWNQKSTKCIFIGYSICRKAYRLWNPQKQMVHEAIDVIFMERDSDNCVANTKTMQKEVSKVIPVSEKDTSDEEMSIEGN